MIRTLCFLLISFTVYGQTELRKRDYIFIDDGDFIEEGTTYVLGVAGTGGYYGEVLFFGNDTPTTTEMDAGSMTITKLDPENNIVSGTFSFDIMNPQGEIVEIRNGRFDQIYDN